MALTAAQLVAELRPIPGYEGVYAITNDGRVWSLPKAWIAGQGRRRSHDGKWLALTPDKDGYLTVHLGRKGVYTMKKVHRLVGLAWVPNPAGLPEINHADNDKANNRASNLEWSTRPANMAHAGALGVLARCGAKNGNSNAYRKTARGT